MAHAATVPKAATWEDILAIPEGIKAEVIAGEIYRTSPRPVPAHGYVQAVLSAEVVPRYGRGGGGKGGDDDHGGAWWILVEPDIALGPHDIVSPDLVGWRRARVPAFPAERPIRDVPDWVCEVLSRSTARRDRLEKSELYLRAGVPHYWLVDPATRTVEAFSAESAGESGRGRWVRQGGWSDETDARIAPFDAADIDVGTLFPPATAESPSA